MSGLDEPYSGFQWDYFSSLSDGSYRARADSFLFSVDWEALLKHASALRDGMECTLLSYVGLGGNHMVRIVRFADRQQWVARLRLPSLKEGKTSSDITKSVLREVSTIALIRQNTRISVPEIDAFESDSNCSVKAPFMLMECFAGNVGMDLGMQVPPEHQQDFFKSLADIHVELSTIKLPMIGTIQGINKDGTIQQGSIPGLGGPFATATEFFQAWCSQTIFGLSGDRLRQACGSYSAELIPSIESFPINLAKVASRLSKFDKGPFPLIHGDFGHNNIVVDDDYQILGVIDWEMAFAAPWEIAGNFPLTLPTVPPAMDAPWNHDATGKAKDPEVADRIAKQSVYVDEIKNAEYARHVIETPRLSSFLQDPCKRHIMTAMRLYSSGRAGFTPIWSPKCLDVRNKVIEQVFANLPTL